MPVRPSRARGAIDRHSGAETRARIVRPCLHEAPPGWNQITIRSLTIIGMQTEIPHRNQGIQPQTRRELVIPLRVDEAAAAPVGSRQVRGRQLQPVGRQGSLLVGGEDIHVPFFLVSLLLSAWGLRLALPLARPE